MLNVKEGNPVSYKDQSGAKKHETATTVKADNKENVNANINCNTKQNARVYQISKMTLSPLERHL